MADRLEQLMAFFEKDPTDAFSAYAIAMEHLSADRASEAIEWFTTVHRLDPDHAYAHYHRARALEAAGQLPEAREAVAEGLRVAQRVSDHAATEELKALADQMA